MGRLRSNSLATHLAETEHRAQPTGNPENVGSSPAPLAQALRPLADKGNMRVINLLSSIPLVDLNVRILNLVGVLYAGKSPDEQLHGGDVDPGFGARDRSLENLCQAAVAIESSEASFDDDPSARQPLEGRALPPPAGQVAIALRIADENVRHAGLIGSPEDESSPAAADAVYAL
jgi:hypothetical protein